ncbi:MAG: type I glyceraldehyde-3-phosphate dehydrogenase [Deltaproteobacteria bacterium]|nr:type I glyceraldehyde-3-phosphate dehydrogenase [Deltaproteobacteria bacterium]
MSIRIGINGFGRIGRAVCRLSLEEPDIEVVQINDLSPPGTLAHLIRYDTVHGTLKADVETSEDAIFIEGKKIHCSQGQEPKAIDWSQSEVDIVLECTGRFRDRSHGEDHLASGVKRVIVSAPGKDSDITLVYGINHQDFDPEKHFLVSNASCTTNCLAPVAQILDQKLGIVKGFMTTVHSYTNDQRLICASHKDLRRSRAAALNQIPTTTGAAKALGLVLPNLKGKIDGMAIRVPTPNVSLIDLVVEVKKESSIEQINQFFQEAANSSLKGILDYCEAPLVSGDFNGSKFSAVVDALSTNVMDKNLIKVLAWYDNETAFSQRMIDLTKYIVGL